MRWLLIAAKAQTVACGDEGDAADSKSPKEAMSQVQDVATRALSAAISGNWDTVYDSLHPVQRAVVNQDLLVDSRSLIAATPYAIVVTQVGHDTMTAQEIYDRSTWAVLYDLQSVRLGARELSIAAFEAGRCD